MTIETTIGTLLIPAHDKPGVWLERTEPEPGEITREKVYIEGDNPSVKWMIGVVVYVRRIHRSGKVSLGSTYGWRPLDSDPRVRLTDKSGAIDRLPGYRAQLERTPR